MGPCLGKENIIYSVQSNGSTDTELIAAAKVEQKSSSKSAQLLLLLLLEMDRSHSRLSGANAAFARGITIGNSPVPSWLLQQNDNKIKPGCLMRARERRRDICRL